MNLSMMRTQTAKTTNAAAKLVVLAVFEDLFQPSGRPFALRFWDGTVEAPKASYEPRFTLALRRPGALRRMLLPPTELALGEAYLHDDFDVEGDLEEATELADFFSTRLRSPTLLARLVRQLRKLPSNDLPENDSSRSPDRHLRGRPHSRKRDVVAVRSHYDVGNEFYALWLDRRMVYSCAYLETGRRISIPPRRRSRISSAASSG